MNHANNLFAFSEKFPKDSLEQRGLIAAATEIVRLRTALSELRDLGREGMKPDYTEWLTFHDKVAQVATEALGE